ncbi:Hypothetical_protein [Hexamita inflata]|uniref:Hypothetical_protein n=1 Tax=Hexamita inflata TaxID=28002 RepID=A0AA86UZE2_9EUKA|nr:Hypothetical protein HINF_LOCUS65940 [Hexamita inflata]
MTEPTVPLHFQGGSISKVLCDFNSCLQLNERISKQMYFQKHHNFSHSPFYRSAGELWRNTRFNIPTHLQWQNQKKPSRNNQQDLFVFLRQSSHSQFLLLYKQYYYSDNICDVPKNMFQRENLFFQFNLFN